MFRHEMVQTSQETVYNPLSDPDFKFKAEEIRFDMAFAAIDQYYYPMSLQEVTSYYSAVAIHWQEDATDPENFIYTETFLNITLCRNSPQSFAFVGESNSEYTQATEFFDFFCLDMSQVEMFGNNDNMVRSSVVFGVTKCQQGVQPGCKSEEERDAFVKERGPQLLFMLPQNYVEFDNFESPIQTYMDYQSLNLKIRPNSASKDYKIVPITINELESRDEMVFQKPTRQYFAEFTDATSGEHFSAFFEMFEAAAYFQLKTKGTRYRRRAYSIFDAANEFGGFMSAVMPLVVLIITQYEIIY
jgi:hypothetical protein